MNNKPAVTANIVARAIVTAIQQAQQSFTECGRLLAEYVDENQNGKEEISKLCGVKIAFLYRLEKVGRGQMHSSLLLDDSDAAEALRKLPGDTQTDLICNGVDVVSLDRGRPVISNKPFSALSKSEIGLVFDGKKLRTPDEQTAQLRVVSQPSQHAKPAERYTILTDGRTVILADTEFTLTQLEEVLDRAKAKAIQSLKSANPAKK